MKRQDSITGLAGKDGKKRGKGVMIFHFRGQPDVAVTEEKPDFSADHTESKKQREALQEEISSLGLDLDEVREGGHSYIKTMPETADDFFEAVANWISGLLDAK